MDKVDEHVLNEEEIALIKAAEVDFAAKLEEAQAALLVDKSFGHGLRRTLCCLAVDAAYGAAIASAGLNLSVVASAAMVTTLTRLRALSVSKCEAF